MYHKRAFGETGVKVSTIGLGTVKLGRNKGGKYPKKIEITKEREGKEHINNNKNKGRTWRDTQPE